MWVIAPFVWVLVHTRFLCALPESTSHSCVSSGSSTVGLMATSTKRAYATPRSAAPRAPAPWQATADPYLHRRHSSTVLAQSLWPFHFKGLECKSRKSRHTWSNRQIRPWCTKQSRSKANRVLPRACTGHSKHPLPTTQKKTLHMDINQMVNTEIRLIIFFAAKDGEALYSQQKQDRS